MGKFIEEEKCSKILNIIKKRGGLGTTELNIPENPLKGSGRKAIIKSKALLKKMSKS